MSPPTITQLIDQLLSASPTFKVTQSTHEVEALRRRVDFQLTQTLERRALDDVDTRALLSAVARVCEHDQLNAALSGDREALTAITDALITQYLSCSPWGVLSERDLASLWYGWVEALSEGVGVHIESLWTEVPTVSMRHWIDLGWGSALERAWTALTHTDAQSLSESSALGVPKIVGVRVTGSGKSAHLAYARRWLMSRGSHVRWLTHESLPHHKQQSSEIGIKPGGLIIDDLHIPTRTLQWSIAMSLTQWRRDLESITAQTSSGITEEITEETSAESKPMRHHGLIVVWSDDSAQEGISALLSAEVDELIEVNLADQWRQHDEVASLEKTMNHHPDLTLSDHLRCRDLIDNSTNRAPQFDLSDIDAYAALIGPLASVNVLTRAVELPEESIREILGNAGWLEVDDHPHAGARFAPPSPEFWRAALLAGGARAHRCAASLQEGLEHVYLGESLMEVRSALQRLSTLRGRGAYRCQVRSALDLESASDALDAIAPAITTSHPSPLSLMTLCGLALDWAKLGPISGRWDDALRALKLGVASAQRLRDPQRAAQLLFMLGKLSLDDGRASVADEALAAALSIFKVTQRADEACRSAQLLAEVSLLRGEVDQALSRLSEAQRLALQLSLPREAWRSRFRAGQLWASIGDHQQALSLWSTLRPAQDQEPKHDQHRALLALTLECAASLLYLDRASEAWDWLERSQTQAPFGQALLSVCRWRMSSENVVTLLGGYAEQTRATRDIGSWVAIQRWRAQVSLEMYEQLSDQEQSQDGLRALSVAQNSLELAVRVLVGARDRLQLISIYQLLARVYQGQGQREASGAALAMASAWKTTLIVPHPVEGLESSDPSGADLLEIDASGVSHSVKDEALSEVHALCDQWDQRPLSSMI